MKTLILSILLILTLTSMAFSQSMDYTYPPLEILEEGQISGTFPYRLFFPVNTLSEDATGVTVMIGNAISGLYVPYAGANANVNLGTYDLTGDIITGDQLKGAYLVSTITGSMDMRGDPWAVSTVGLSLKELIVTDPNPFIELRDSNTNDAWVLHVEMGGSDPYKGLNLYYGTDAGTFLQNKLIMNFSTAGLINFYGLDGYTWSRTAPADGQVPVYDETTHTILWSSAGAGDVTAAANIDDHTVIRGDGGAKGIQDSGITLDDTNNITGVASLTATTLTDGTVSINGGAITGIGSMTATANIDIGAVTFTSNGFTIANNENFTIGVETITFDGTNFVFSDDITSDGYNLGSGEYVIWGGSETLDFTTANAEFQFSDDIALVDANPHFKFIDSTASEDDFEIYADNNRFYITNITDSKVLAYWDIEYNMFLQAGSLYVPAGKNIYVAGNAVLTSYTETDTLQSVCARGAVYTGTITVNGVAMDTTETVAWGAETLTHNATDFVMTDDLVLTDTTPALRLDPSGAGDTIEFYATDDSCAYISNVTDSKPFIKFDAGYNCRILNGSLTLQNGRAVNEFSDDITLGGNSNDAIPTEKAVKSYVDNKIIITEKTIVFPDSINNTVEIVRVDAEKYPNGIEITSISIGLPSDAAYSLVFKEYTGDPPALVGTIATVTTGAGDAYTKVTGANINDPVVAADNMIFVTIPATDVDSVHFQVLGNKL